jgi:hypothetical protein
MSTAVVESGANRRSAVQIRTLLDTMPFRPIGRTPDFGSGDYGSNPWRAIP